MDSAGDLDRRLTAALQGVEAEGVVSAYLFGSHAEGRAHRESDVDVGVLLDRRALPSARDRFEAGLRLSSRLQSSLGTRSVDLVVLNDAPPGLGRHVVRGRRLLCVDAEADHAFVRDVQLRAADLEPFLRRTRRLKLQALQLVIDVAGDFAARRGDRFEDYTEAVRSLGRDTRFTPELAQAGAVARLPERGDPA